MQQTRIYRIFIAIGHGGQPYPCTIAHTIERTWELAALAFGATWATLATEGFAVHHATLMVGDVVDALPVEVRP